MFQLTGLPRRRSGKESAYEAGDVVQSLGQEDPLEREMATHSNNLVCEFPWTESLLRLQSMGSQRDRHDLATKQQRYNGDGN